MPKPALPADDHTRSSASSRGIAFYPYFPFGAPDIKLSHFPQIITICDLFPLTQPGRFNSDASARFRRQLHMVADVDHVFCISNYTKQELHRAFPTLRATSSVVHLAADSVPAERADGLGIVRAFWPRLKERYFVCVGTIEPRKNLSTVVEAFQRLCLQDDDLRMKVVGQAGCAVSTKDLLDREGLDASRIEFLGHVPDDQLWRIYKGAICTVFPSLGEGFGLPILESFRCGTPVVTSNRTSMPEIATKGAILVNPEDPNDIANAIFSITHDRRLRRRLSEDCRQRAKDFSWARCADDHVKVFTELARSRHVALTGTATRRLITQNPPPA